MDHPPDLILASASPRRRELLERLGLRLAVVPTEIDETPRTDERAADYVRRMAADKLAAVIAASSRATPGDQSAWAILPLLAADTIVIVDGMILGKPRGADDARTMLAKLAGRRHEVTTAYRVSFRGRELDRAITTTVAFRLLDPAELESYVQSDEWHGKAGGYAVQGVAAAFVTELRGSPTNVIGLPLAEVLADLRALGALPGYPPQRFPTVA